MLRTPRITRIVWVGGETWRCQASCVGLIKRLLFKACEGSSNSSPRKTTLSPGGGFLSLARTAR
jgi:hypothetical protein